MWLTFGLTGIVAGAWITQMIAEKRIAIQRTPLDIPIVLFLISQILATLFSMDQHVSWWGYYSRFNGGLFSTICYITLYYAFVSTLNLRHVIKSLYVTLVAGFLTALWGFPAHFGYDPTCLMFRGTFDTSCWTEAFKPTIRTFSTLGQPAWFAAYLAMLIPLATAVALETLSIDTSKKPSNPIKAWFSHWKGTTWMYFALTAFFYANLLYSNTRAGFIAFVVTNAIFWITIWYKRYFNTKQFIRNVLIFNLTFVVITFFNATPFQQINNVTLSGLTSSSEQQAPPEETLSGQTVIPGNNVTDSGDIRLLVWEGALNAWKSSPIFGTGVETFAFAYYQFKPVGHNLTSEWDYLYNKAHNEYLNYLATTGILGLGSYLMILGFFIVSLVKYLYNDFFKRIKTKTLLTNKQPESDHKTVELHKKELVVIGLFAGWLSILITNFFGFSVVLMNLYLFFLPIFVFIILSLTDNYAIQVFPSDATNEKAKQNAQAVGAGQWTVITVVILLVSWMLIDLIGYRQADIAYALGNNLNKIGNFQQAYPELTKAVDARPNEPVYKDELSINLAALGAGLAAQGDATNGAQLADTAIILSDELVQKHPQNIVYWKNRVRLFYTLSAGDETKQGQYLKEALEAINKAQELSPNDAKITYNRGVLYGQTGNYDKGVEILKRTIELKPNYTEAYIALGLFYHEQSVGEDGETVVDAKKNQEAIDTYQFILDTFDPNNEEVKNSLKQWQGSQP